MASRAHLIHQYPPSGALRPRREVWFRSDDEPVVLPRRRSSDVNFTLVAAGLAAAALTFGAAFALYGASAPVLAPSEPASITPSWTPDPEPVRATLVERLSGPAPAAPGLVQGVRDASDPPQQSSSLATGETGERELTGDEASLLSKPPETSFTIERPVKPGELGAAPAGQRPEAPIEAPYPNPTTTPPEVMPQDAPSLPAPAPAREQDNPY